jgi:hypothetical protein
MLYNSSFKYCERAGILFDGGNEGIVWNTVSGAGNRYGLILQDEPKPDCSDSQNHFFGTEENVLTDGALPVPEPPPLPSEP